MIEMTDEQRATAQAAKAIADAKRREQMQAGHTVKKEGGGTVLIKPYSIRRAIALNCTECMGFAAGEVKDCTSPTCPLFPFRRGTMLAKKGMAASNALPGA
jgi:hypothetical protein